MRVLPRFTTAAASAILVLVVVLPARAQSGEEAAVARAVDAFRQAGLSADSIQFGALLAPELSYGHSNGVVQNKPELIELAMHTLVAKSIDLSDRHVNVVGDDAIVRHTFTAELVNRKGETIPVHIGVMEVWQKRDGNWVMFAHQAYPLAVPK
jgi:hypothetical protein